MRDSVSEPFALSLLLFRSFITAESHHSGVMMQPSSHPVTNPQRKARTITHGLIMQMPLNNAQTHTA